MYEVCLKCLRSRCEKEVWDNIPKALNLSAHFVWVCSRMSNSANIKVNIERCIKYLQEVIKYSGIGRKWL